MSWTEILGGCLRFRRQPIVDLVRDIRVGDEVLVRGPAGSDRERPDQLFDQAQEDGVVPQLDAAILQSTVAQIKASSTTFPPRLMVNVMRRSLTDSLWRRVLERVIHNLPRQTRLCIEITEHGSLVDSIEYLRSLRDTSRDFERTLEFAIDDFGTGESNFKALIELEPEIVKLDMSMIRDIHNEPAKQSFVQGVLTYAQDTDIQIVAEGIETDEEYRALRDFDLEYGQGYYFEKPQPIVPYSSVQAVPIT